MDITHTRERRAKTMRNAEIGTLGRRLVVGMRASAAALIVVGAWSFYVAASASSASAATLGGTATITNPNNNQPLGSGGSTTVFGVDLPAQAACSGDTATDKYHVFSYLVPESTAVTSLSFGTGSPSAGLGLADGSGYYGSANTAPTTGQIINIPTDFEWADLGSLGGTAATLDAGGGVWNTGIACANSSGALTDYWNSVVTFTANGNDPNGFVWTAVPGTGSTTTTTTTTTASSTTSTTTASSTTTSTTIPSSTTTTSGSGGGSTTTAAGSTSASSGSTGSGSTGSGSTGSGSSGAANSAVPSATSASGGSLAFTGALITRGVAIGLLCLGFGLIMFGLSVKVRREITPRVMLR